MRAAVEQLAPTVGVVAACEALGVPRASVYRHRVPGAATAPQGAPAASSAALAPPERVSPTVQARALTPLERAEILETLHEERFVDRAPAAVWATLLEEGRYLCSIRTMYRVLQAAGEVAERRPQRRHPRRVPPRLVATAPNQVWTWDITRLATVHKWTTYALYVVLDLFSRYVVAWMVAERETAHLAKRLVREACQKQSVEPGQLILHQDRGAPMTAKTFSQLLVDLDVLASYSRPRVSDDNAFSESQFKTVKYAPGYPGNFNNPEHALSYFRVFFPWYNTQHRHSGLGLHTPEAVHSGAAEELQVVRQQTLDAAYAANPERFVNGPPQAPCVPKEVWINRPHDA